MAAGGSKGTGANGRGGSSSSSSSSSGSKGASSSSPAGGASAASGGGSQSSSKGSSSAGASKGASSSSPAGGARGASGGGSQSSSKSSGGAGGSKSSSGPSSSSPAGGSRAASGGGSTSSSSAGSKSGNAGGQSKGASSSSPAGGSRAASGGGSMSSGASASRSTGGNSGSKSASASSPAGGSRAASGVGVSGSTSTSLGGGASGRATASVGSTTTAAGKTGRVGSSISAGFDSGRFGDAAPAARGTGAVAGATGLATGRGLAAGLTARSAQESSMSSLAADRASNASRFGSKPTARAAEDTSMSTLAAQRSIGAVARAAPDTARFGAKPTARAAEDGSMTTLAAQRSIGAVPNAAPAPGPKFAEKSPRVSTAVTERMLGVNSDAVADMLAGRQSAPAPSNPTARAAQDGSMTALGAAQAAGTVPGKTGRIGKGLAAVADIDPERFGPNMPTPMASSLRTSPNYGKGYAQQARAAEDASLGSLYDYDREVVGVAKAGPGYTQVTLRDGTVETRKGTRASRNNNPGNIEFGSYAKKAGAIGTDGRFAVFDSPKAGLKAMEGLVFGASYADKSIQGAINKYAPPHENDSVSYASTIAKAAGVPTSTRVSDLTPKQREALIGAMTRMEGSKPYSSETVVAGTPRGTPPSAQSKTSRATSVAAGPTSSAPTSRPAAKATTERFAETYLGKVPTPTARPAQGKKVRSLGEKVLAGAIDVGVGMIPGVGLAAGLYGLAAPMVGLPTVGEMALNLRDQNQFSVTDAANKKTSSGNTAGAPAKTTSTAPAPAPAAADAAPAPVQSVAAFSEKYLGFSDPIPRETPEQKWGGIGSNSAPYRL